MSEQEASLRSSSSAPSAPRHWRIQVCRWLWGVLRPVWGTLIVGITIGIVVNLSTASTDTLLDKLNIVHLAQTYPLPVRSGLGFLVVLTLLSWLGSREEQATPAHPLSKQDRIHMLHCLRLHYEQLLRQSLQAAVQLELGLAEKPVVAQQSLGLVLRVSGQPEQPLLPYRSIVQAYKLAQQELLILGGPDAGKSTLLLELACYLVQQAEQDATQPLPLILPLSTWAVSRRRLDEWLGEEIARLYNVQRRFSQQLIQTEQVLPLLDGLDEMEETARSSCIAAINKYHSDHLRPPVVCSRISEYEGASAEKQLAPPVAVIVQPLSQEQVDTHLKQVGKHLAGLRTVLRMNPAPRELATTPLMFQVLMLTYQDTVVRELSRKEAELKRQIWTDFMQYMIEHKGNQRRYPLLSTRGWLNWLARQMQEHDQAMMSIEQLQSDWLPERRSSWYYRSVRLVGGLVGALTGGLLFGLVSGLTWNTRSDTSTTLTKVFTWVGKAVRSALAGALGVGPVLEALALFLMLTRPSTHKRTAKVWLGRGVRLYQITYWNEALCHPEVERIEVPVRYDPFDLGVAYAFVPHRWVEYISQYYTQLHGHSGRELELAAAELRRRAAGQRTALDAKRLTDFLTNAQAYEALLLQWMRDLWRPARSSSGRRERATR